jgi:NMD protein affecting ribosome stability and mRNA decay
MYLQVNLTKIPNIVIASLTPRRTAKKIEEIELHLHQDKEEAPANLQQALIAISCPQCQKIEVYHRRLLNGTLQFRSNTTRMGGNLDQCQC